MIVDSRAGYLCSKSYCADCGTSSARPALSAGCFGLYCTVHQLSQACAVCTVYRQLLDRAAPPLGAIYVAKLLSLHTPRRFFHVCVPNTLAVYADRATISQFREPVQRSSLSPQRRGVFGSTNGNTLRQQGVHAVPFMKTCRGHGSTLAWNAC